MQTICFNNDGDGDNTGFYSVTEHIKSFLYKTECSV